MDKELFSFEKLKELASIWPLLVFAPTFLGYVSFFTYSWNFGTTNIKPDLSTIICLGIYHLLILGIAYLFSINKNIIQGAVFLTILFYALSIGINLIFVFSIISLFFVGAKNTIKQIRFQKPFKEKRILVLNRKIRRLKSNKNGFIKTVIFPLVIPFLITIFYDIYAFILYSLFMNLIEYFHKIKSKTHRAITYFIIIIITPIFLSHFVYITKNHILFGLKSSNVIIELYNCDQYEGMVLYQSENHTFLKSENNFIQISNQNINTITKTKSDESPLSLIEIINKYPKNNP